MRTIGDFCNKNQRDYYDVSNNICQLPTKKTLVFQYVSPSTGIALGFFFSMYLGFQSRFPMINLPHDFSYKAKAKPELHCAIKCHIFALANTIVVVEIFVDHGLAGYISGPVNRSQSYGQHLCVNLFIPFGSSGMCMNETEPRLYSFVVVVTQFCTKSTLQKFCSFHFHLTNRQQKMQ